MPPYEIRTEATYDGEKLLLSERLPLQVGQQVEVTIVSKNEYDRISVEERLRRFDEYVRTRKPLDGVDWSKVSVDRNDPEMYPDRC